MYAEQPPFLLGMQILPAYVASNHVFVSTGCSLKFRYMKLSEGILATVVRYYQFLTEEEFVYDSYLNKVIMSYVKKKNKKL